MIRIKQTSQNHESQYLWRQIFTTVHPAFNKVDKLLPNRNRLRKVNYLLAITKKTKNRGGCVLAEKSIFRSTLSANRSGFRSPHQIGMFFARIPNKHFAEIMNMDKKLPDSAKKSI